MRTIKFILFFALTLFVNSCTNDEFDDLGYSTNNEHIKSISANGITIQKYLYDKNGKIMEENSSFYFKKYIYDENGRLEKVESAFDKSISSSYYYVPRKTELMTSQNSTAENFSLYNYDKGKLSKIEHYSNLTEDDFEYRSMQTFEYKGGIIIRENSHDTSGQITQYYVYTYDKNGNVSNEKYYTNLFGSKDELLSEVFYKYDNYKNPYRIFSITGSPGMYTNANNIIESYSISYHDYAGIDKESRSKTHYKYNHKGYPIKEIIGNNEFDYSY